MLYGKIMGDNYTSITWTSYSHQWRNLRRIASIELLSLHHLNELHGIRVDEGRLMIHKLLLTNSSLVNMKSVFYELMLNVMMRMITGKRYFNGDISDVEEEGKRLKNILDEMFLSSSASNVVDYLLSLRLINQLKQVKGVEVENKKKTMIEVLLSLQRSDPEYYTDEMIKSFVMVMRSCPGVGLALRTVGLSLGLLIQCFEWERISEDMVDMTEDPGLTMPKAKPLLGKCTPRLVMQNLLSEL
ncbi:hypothetical protein L6452_33879 [Arctium lappa]|uniref:Uncharacterized protein n=1 Tax=Arctium lappa TaxID=4217 RepID=A0ACB8YI91_ARCLA|nr:hypothetical protein L6452_33879 [Arctium lappa]